MARYRIPVDGMTCEHCERTVERAVTGAGATGADADWRRGEVVAEVADDAVDGARSAIATAGYQPGDPERLDTGGAGTAGDTGESAPRRAAGGDPGYDLAIVGSGSAAFAAAIRAANLGARTVVVERGTVGGTCVNVGCVPSKTLLAAAATRHRAADHPFDGLPTSAGAPDLAALVAQKDELVGRLRQAKYVDLAPEYGFGIRRGTARFTGPGTLEVDGEPLDADAFLVATGAEPHVPDLPGLAEAGYLTSTTAMELDAVPGRLVVVGGGFVGLEMGQLFARLGAKVTIVGRLAPRAEPELSEWLGRVFADEGIDVVGERAVAVELVDGERVVVGSGGTRIATDAVLVATGRHARVAELGLDEAGIKLDEDGFVAVDDHLRTSNPKVYAAGDVVGGPQYVYVAAAQGNLAADNAVGGADRTMDYTALPSVIFTDPSLAAAGLTEAEARDRGLEVESRVLELADVPRALANRDTRGAVKLVVDAGSRKVLGVHALAEGAGDVIQAGVYAVRFGLTVEDLASTWAPYLTMAEALKLAAQSFSGDVKRLSCCAA